MAASTLHTGPFRDDSAREPERWGSLLSWGALLALALWAAAPLVYLAIQAMTKHESMSGADSLFAADQMQYLAWIRSEGEHVLAANDFALHSGRHVFLHPMFLISGLLWRAGLNIAVSYLIWLPVAVGVLYVGFRRFVWRMIDTPVARGATLVLALFFVTPADPLAGWTVGSNGLGTLAGELAPTGALYGYLPLTIAVGLTGVFMVGLERVCDAASPERRRGYVALTALAGGLASWLHPWQGATALIVACALLVIHRSRHARRALLILAGATALPLGYYLVLSRIDIGWKIAGSQSPGGRPNVLLLVLAVAPLLAFGLPVVLRRRSDPVESTLWLWPVAGLLVYFLSPEYGPHALAGLSLPLSVLAVRGFRELRWPGWAAAAAILLATAPGLLFNLKLFHEVAASGTQPLLLSRDERRAIAYLERFPAGGGVLPSLRISSAIPAYTGRRSWLGHALWTPDYGSRAYAVSALFSGRLTGAPARRFLRQAGARYLLADCEPGFAPVWLGSLLVHEARFGCVVVYELSVPNRAASL